MNKFDRNSNQTNKLPLPIALIWFAIATLVIILLIQNWQFAIVVYFLGQKTLALPLSLTMLIALCGGGVVAMVINLLFKLTKNLESNPEVEAKPKYQSQYEDDDFDDDYIEIKYTKR